jgi:hypothetical protein
METRPGPDLVRQCGGKIKGFAVVNLLAMARERYGDESVQAYARTLPDDLRTLVDKKLILASAWLPMELYYAGIAFWVERHHGGDPLAARTLGHDLTSKDIHSFLKMVLGFTSPRMVIGLSGRLWGMYLDRGTLAVVEAKDGRVVGEITGWPLCDVFTANELAGGTLAFLESSRGKNARIESIESPSSTRLRLTLAYE